MHCGMRFQCLLQMWFEWRIDAAISCAFMYMLVFVSTAGLDTNTLFMFRLHNVWGMFGTHYVWDML